ncbi:Calcium related spray [Fusarium albosuccineum]|uniref:Calcium related spray n=1 Tax=Fusarium albosuccineum TaxID=1237068 RepID=A0A8H4LFG2_9HYPO|nr:Calcium related spray [Fusarium albosuccineum]
MLAIKRPLGALFSLLAAISLIPIAYAQDRVLINGTDSKGLFRDDLDVGRTPALYTGDFDDCLSDGSLFNVTGFDAAYYADNLTVSFHLYGSSNIRRENIMMHLSIEVYGEDRYNKTYNPCNYNVTTLCPLNAGVPIEAYVATSISADDVAGIPSIALDIPDLEGFARLRLFANSTQTEIGCFQAVMTNGQSFSQPESVGSIVGVFVFFAVLASFATAIYGLQVPHMRMHYAHSFSILVIFETFQSIFFSGALSVDWPSVLPAWWSNFAWTAGMFASDSMIHSISPFAGVTGNASQVGSAGSVPINNGGGLTQQIYGRSLKNRAVLRMGHTLHSFARRNEFNASDPYDYSWAGKPRDPGMPLPGYYSDFAGTLSRANIPLYDAFLVGLIWLLVVLGGVVLFVVSFKLVLELCAKLKWIKTDGFDYFRSHWLGYLVVCLLRTLFIAFFTLMTLALYQFTLDAPAGPTAIAAIVFIMFLGFAGLTAYACAFRLREGKYEVVSDSIRFEEGKLFKTIPFIAATLESSIGEEEQARKPRLYGSMPVRRIKFTDNDPDRPNAHQDVAYIKRFGWLSARYRRTRWWFFAAYLAYQFIRACFIGGGRRNALAQVYGLFIFEVLALVAIIKLKPFEGARNTTVAVWLLSISKIITNGLSIALLPSFNLSRIVATVLGMIIIVVQAFLAVVVLILIVLGMVSTWMSLSRNREKFPEKLDPIRIRYFEHMEARAGNLPPKQKEAEEPEPPKSTFRVSSVRRAPKMDDSNAFPMLEGPGVDVPAHPMHPLNRRSRTNSASSRFSTSSLPRSGRTHRASWSAKDFAEWDAEMNRGDTARVSRMRSSSLRVQAARYSASRPPMTPTRESAEFPRMSINTMRPEDKEAIAQDKIEESDDTPRRRKRTVSWADQTTVLGTEPTGISPKKDEAIRESEEGKKNQDGGDKVHAEQ